MIQRSLELQKPFAFLLPAKDWFNIILTQRKQKNGHISLYYKGQIRFLFRVQRRVTLQTMIRTKFLLTNVARERLFSGVPPHMNLQMLFRRKLHVTHLTHEGLLPGVFAFDVLSHIRAPPALIRAKRATVEARRARTNIGTSSSFGQVKEAETSKFIRLEFFVWRSCLKHLKARREP